MARLVLESWSYTGTINRAIDLNLAYQALRTRLGSSRPESVGQTSTQDREPTPTKNRGGGRRSRDQHQTQFQRRNRETKNDPSEQQRVISPPGDVEEASKHSDSPATTLTAEGTKVTPVHQQPTSGTSNVVGNELTGQGSYVQHRYNLRQMARRTNSGPPDSTTSKL
ncbi:unnamed protein product [Dibothriocephalus latus]|uniref:Uncharacterized protein n=1 Tax=Dibothriocephalus latus TaxID=60516 RepID=A0A3P7PAY9_DIBLA|nr:unnamed protein product [Dibothriocephalus latus]